MTPKEQPTPPLPNDSLRIQQCGDKNLPAKETPNRPEAPEDTEHWITTFEEDKRHSGFGG